MLQITKKIVLGLSLCVAAPLFSNAMNTDMIETINQPEALRTASDHINNEIDKILKYSEKLKTANPSRREILESKIGECQQKIRNLNLSITENNALNNRTIKQYAFNVEENSLELCNFAVKRTDSYANFELSLKADKTGDAQIDIVSPGGELLKSFAFADFDGSLSRVIELSAEKGMIYFVHMRIGNTETTKKVRFS